MLYRTTTPTPFAACVLPAGPPQPLDAAAGHLLLAQLDYARAKGRLDELSAVAEHLPAAVLRARRRLRLDELSDAAGHLRAAREEQRLAGRRTAERGFAAACEAQRATLACLGRP